MLLAELEYQEGQMTEADYEERLKSTGRNDRCPCGSGKKYKKCHLIVDESKHSAALNALEQEAIARTAESVEDEESEQTATTAKKRSTGRQPKKQPDAKKARTADGTPKNVPRRSAV